MYGGRDRGSFIIWQIIPLTGIRSFYAAVGDSFGFAYFAVVGKIKKYAQNGKTRSLAAIMEEDYPLLAEIRKYSKADYEHAKSFESV